jgi:stage II sporulation protein M
MVSGGPVDFLKKQFSVAVRSARRARIFVCLAGAFFAVGVAGGLLFSERFDALLDSLRIIAERFKGKGAETTVVLIFLRNFFAVSFSLLTGALLGIVPVFAAVINGVLVGVVLSYGKKTGLLAVLGSLLPHGIFELPAIFLSWGMGIWLGTWPFRRDTRETFCERLRGALSVFFLFIVPLLMIAAVIEGLSIAALANH